MVVLLALALGVLPVNAQNACGGPATAISAIQGSGATSPMSGQTVTIEAVVVGDFQKPSVELRGFFVQQPTPDNDPATSEGLFVFDPNTLVDVKVGDRVHAQGQVKEFTSGAVTLTELDSISGVTVCASDVPVQPTAVTLPLPSGDAWERYEGILLTFPQTLTVSENYDLARYGSVLLSEGGRLYNPTQIVAPGAAAQNQEAQNRLRSITLDDGNLQQNRDPVAYPAGGLSASNTLRDGDTVTGLTGVLDQRNDAYRIQPTGPVNFQAANPRPTTAPDVGGTLRVASMNVLNYFNGDGQGGGFPTSRGASTAQELTRQRDKMVSVILGTKADVIALMEVENDGYGPQSAIADIVNSANAASAPGTYAFINPGFDLGTDEIRVAIIYKPASAQPVGAAATLNDAAFPRLPLAQTFEAGGGRFTLVANHLKSKGSCPQNSSDPNADKGDGQSCWNALRNEAAGKLAAWLKTDPTHSGSPNVLIVGDLNAYRMEDPVKTLEGAGFTYLEPRQPAYSFVFDGEAGALDHALASSELAAQVSGVAEWHINADEPRALDYNVEFKSAGQVQSFYSPLPFRASDHDPVLIGLNLNAAVTPEPTGDVTAEPTTEPTVEVTTVVTSEPTVEVTSVPTSEPTAENTPVPTAPVPTAAPTAPGSGGTTPPGSDDSNLLVAIGIIVVMILGFFGALLRGRR
jgi:predicted extracellular nuclease